MLRPASFGPRRQDQPDDTFPLTSARKWKLVTVLTVPVAVRASCVDQNLLGGTDGAESAMAGWVSQLDSR